jgi:hypothetical protein
VKIFEKNEANLTLYFVHHFQKTKKISICLKKLSAMKIPLIFAYFESSITKIEKVLTIKKFVKGLKKFTYRFLH